MKREQIAGFMADRGQGDPLAGDGETRAAPTSEGQLRQLRHADRRREGEGGIAGHGEKNFLAATERHIDGAVGGDVDLGLLRRRELGGGDGHRDGHHPRDGHRNEGDEGKGAGSMVTHGQSITPGSGSSSAASDLLHENGIRGAVAKG